MKPKAGKSLLRYILHMRPGTVFAVILAFAAAVLAVTVYTYLMLVYRSTVVEHTRHVHTGSVFSPASQPTKSPVLWIHHTSDLPLAHVITVFNRLGFTLGGPGEDWDVMWAYKYPFKSLPRDTLRNLKPHHKINHFPGSGCFTYKPQLATLHFPFIPKAFRLPLEVKRLQNEATAHPEKLWVVKSNMHRGIRLKNIQLIDLRAAGSFVQEFIANPLLIDGRKFDIGIYTAITSVDPLRVYTYEEEILVRFCSEDYLPFRPSEPKTYVVDDDYTQTQELPSLAPLITKHHLSHKQAINTVLRKKGYEPERVWEQANSAIEQVLLHCESMMVNYTMRIASDSRNFFELVRFDFVIDDELKVWLMEVNLSPNLSSARKVENRFLYEQVIYNLLNLVGLARVGGQSARYNGEYESVIVVSDRDIQIPLKECIEEQCPKECSIITAGIFPSVCKLCSHCRSEGDSFRLKTAFLEHVNRRNFRRVYPPPITRPSLHNNTRNLSPANFLMNTWFEGKCRLDISWCT